MEKQNMYHAMLLTEFLTRATGAGSSPNYLAYIVCDHNDAYEGGDVPYHMVASAKLAAEIVTERLNVALEAAMHILQMPELEYRRITTEKPTPLPKNLMIEQELHALGIGNFVEIGGKGITKIDTEVFMVDGEYYYNFFEACRKVAS